VVNSPRDMLTVRRDMIVSARGLKSPSVRISGMSNVIGKTQVGMWDMFYGTPDLTDLFTEMRKDVLDEEMEQTLIQDLVRKRGQYGYFVVGFDSRNRPRMRMPVTEQDLHRADVNYALREDPYAEILHAKGGETPFHAGLLGAGR
jgi:hypothetical protein